MNNNDKALEKTVATLEKAVALLERRVTVLERENKKTRSALITAQQRISALMSTTAALQRTVNNRGG